MKFDIRRLQATASTNDDAKQAAASGAGEGLVIWALQQSAGRGRQGRQWFSPQGNLYFSTLLRPACAMRDYGRYSFVAALAVHEAVNSLLSQSGGGNNLVQLKWPNDVLVDGKKISGILLEAGEGWLVVGVGVNVLHVPENPLYPVTSLAAEKAEMPTLEVLLDKILRSLGDWSARLNREGFAPVRAAWLARARKGMMRVRLPSGEIEGEFADLDENGNLSLILADGTAKTVNAGDVFF